MAQHSTLDGVFQAVSDPTRRAVIGRLGTGPASIGELAAPFDMALPSFMKHIGHLERCGLIRTRKSGRVRICTLERDTFTLIEKWLGEQRSIWTGRTDRLEEFVASALETGHDNLETDPDKESPA
ncbi:helix-turn-helix domain-containing protein [Cryobacterium sp. 1639]|uniref:ArsR/SmtB family transcription factor n=1 Tax=Cryobacterium inferilacus TaxID=2866629 RepID=UPI001C735B04|nr:metalloregulator ArsR/SmtB family transcription factor [Cryobacterium sp. 1639]MBX0300064.1 helix-turn-helix domain-containing protein [Cryobacterium sp. 1639]